MNGTYILALSALANLAGAVVAAKAARGRTGTSLLLASGACILLALEPCIRIFRMFAFGSFQPYELPGTSDFLFLAGSLLLLAGILAAFLASRGDAEPRSQIINDEKYRIFFEESRDAIYLVNSEGRIMDCNEAMLSLFGCSRGEMIGRDVAGLYANRDERNEFAGRLYREGYVRDYELKLRGRMNSEIDCMVTVALVRSASGAVEGYQGIIRDISRQKEMQERLIRKNHLLDIVLNASPIGMCLVQGNTLNWANRAMCNMLQRELREIQGREMSCLYPNEREYALVSRQICTPSSEQAERRALTRWIRKDGSILQVLLQAGALNPLEPSRGRVIAALDVTELKQKETNLQDSEDRRLRFMEDDLAGVYISTPEGRLLSCNSAFVRILGFSSIQEAIDSNLQFLYEEPGARKKFVELVCKERKVVDYRNRLIRRDGKCIHVIENATGIFDADGQLSIIKGCLLDMTQQADLEEQLRQAQKMVALGRLAGGIAHDFNNMLTAINGYCDVLLLHPGDDDFIRRNALEIKKASERAEALTRQLLAFSRKKLLQPVVVDLNAVIFDMVAMLERIIGEHIELSMDLSPALGRIRIVKGQLEQVILNLVVNARDAMPEGGKLTIETADITIDDADSGGHPAVQPGRYAMLAINDTGRGMDSSVLSRLFEPFFTTKERAKGAGIGMATLYGIIEQCEGRIIVDSKPGCGTTFKIYLPSVDADITDNLQNMAQSSPSLGTETILLVEDDELVRNILAESLHMRGYTVLVSGTGNGAFQVCKEHPGGIDLLVTDIVLPGMNGRKLAETLARSQPGIKVLYISGYTDRGIIGNGMIEAGADFLQKPFGLDALAEKIREVLDRGKAGKEFSTLEDRAGRTANSLPRQNKCVSH